MTSYNKTYLETLARKNGFIRDNLEKVLRLKEILTFMQKNDMLSESLVLKGGTAINLSVFQMPRLSVDIDLDYNINCSRTDMLHHRQQINDLLLRYMASEGYQVKPTSKSPLSLDSWVFGYTNAGNNQDSIKIEINYSNRCHVLPAEKKHVNIDFLGEFDINVLNITELFASKINALVSRGALRDLYDVNNMLQANLFNTDKELALLRKTYVFYHCVGATSKAEEVTLEHTRFPKIETITHMNVKTQLTPVLRKHDHFDFQQAKPRVTAFLNTLMQFDDGEQSFVQKFRNREYHPELLFGPGTITERIQTHPMALWKCRPPHGK